VQSFRSLSFFAKAREFFLLLLFLAALIRLLLYVWQFSQETLQMDFAAFYTAGESLIAGMSPYDNLVINEPPLWDGVARSVSSRFFYPPLTATLLTPLAALTYPQAKLAWLVGSWDVLCWQWGLPGAICASRRNPDAC